MKAKRVITLLIVPAVLLIVGIVQAAPRWMEPVVSPAQVIQQDNGPKPIKEQRPDAVPMVIDAYPAPGDYYPAPGEYYDEFYQCDPDREMVYKDWGFQECPLP